MEEGILDLNIPMIYRREQAVTEPNNHRRIYEEWGAFTKDHQYNRTAAIGTALYLNPIEDSVIQIRKALSPSPAGNLAQGWVGFSYRNPDVLVNERRRPPDEGRLQLARALTQMGEPEVQLSALGISDGAPFATPVPVPTMPWKALPATGHLHVQLRTPEGDTADQTWVGIYHATTGALAASRLTDGAGWLGFVGLAPGEYMIAVGASPELSTTYAVASVVAGRVTPVWLVFSR
jgi:hypothetical protein